MSGNLMWTSSTRVVVYEKVGMKQRVFVAICLTQVTNFGSDK